MVKKILYTFRNSKELIKEIESQIWFEIIETKLLLKQILENKWRFEKKQIDYILEQFKDLWKMSLYIPGFVLPWWTFWIICLAIMQKKGIIKYKSHEKLKNS